MDNVIPFPILGERVARQPVVSAIDNLTSFETPNMRWLREAGEHFRRANEEARNDPGPEAA